jgi:tetratricopeptide (TPR) repeat protein
MTCEDGSLLMIRLVSVILGLCLLMPTAWTVAQDEGEPMTALELFQAGQTAYQRRDFETARQHFEQFLEAYGEAEEVQEAVKSVRPLLAICFIRTRNFDEAHEGIDKVLEDSSTMRSIRLELTFWKGVCQLQAADYSGSQVTFGTYYKKAPRSDPRRMEAAILFGTGYILQEQFADAISFLEERIKDAEESAPEAAARLMTLQLHAYLQTNQLDEAVALTLRAAKRFDQFVQIIGLQSLMLELGSRLLEGERYYDAIRCFHYVWSHERLISLQTSRQERLEKRIRTLKARGDADALVFQLDGILTRIERELEHFSMVEHYNAALRLRIATAYLGLQRYREGALIMEGMLARMEPNKIVEGASVNLVQCWMQEERWDRAAMAADLYLTRFGYDAPNASAVLFMKGQAWQSARLYEDALLVFDDCLSRYPKDPMTPNASFMRGICQLQLERYEEAITIFQQVPIAFPKQAQLAESSLYWEGMAHSFATEHSRCLELMERHLKKFPEGYYRADAAFRIAFSHHALADYGVAVPSFFKFLKDHADSSYADEARLLLGDAYLAEGELEKGMASYATISPESIRFFEDGYFKTGKALKLSERFEDMATPYQAFIDGHASSARLPEALHWLAWLKQREGDMDGARRFYWKAINEHGDDPDKPSVLDLVMGLEKLYTGPDRESLIETWTEKRVEALQTKRSTLAVRCLWAKALALNRAKSVQSAVLLIEAVPELQPEIHSARILVDCADALHFMRASTEAAALYQEIVKWHPNALERDRADVGLATEAMRVKDYAQALKHLERVEKRQSGSVRLGEILTAKADCQDQMGDRKNALVTLEVLLGDKTVPSKTKVGALMQCAQWLVAGNELKKALVYFERVYLVYGRYAAQVATAYWSRGQLLEKLGELEKAQELYREFVSREELKDYPEYALAEARVQ